MSLVKIGVEAVETEKGIVHQGRRYKKNNPRDIRAPLIQKFIEAYKKQLPDTKKANHIIQGLDFLDWHQVIRVVAERDGEKYTRMLEYFQREFGRKPNHFDLVGDSIDLVRGVRNASRWVWSDPLISICRARPETRNQWNKAVLAAGIYGSTVVRSTSMNTVSFSRKESKRIGYVGSLHTSVYPQQKGKAIEVRVQNNSARIVAIQSSVRRTLSGEPHKTQQRIANRECAPSVNRNEIVISHGYAGYFSHCREAQNGWVASRVEGIEGFQLLMPPVESHDVTKCYAAGYQDGYWWMYIVNLVDDGDVGLWVVDKARRLTHNPMLNQYSRSNKPHEVICIRKSSDLETETVE